MTVPWFAVFANGWTEEVTLLIEFDLVGLAGRAARGVTAAAGPGVDVPGVGVGGSTIMLPGVLMLPGKGLAGATLAVGVGTGVFAELKEKLGGAASAGFAVASGVYTSPNSPGEKVRVLQKPSEEDIRRV